MVSFQGLEGTQKIVVPFCGCDATGLLNARLWSRSQFEERRPKPANLMNTSQPPRDEWLQTLKLDGVVPNCRGEQAPPAEDDGAPFRLGAMGAKAINLDDLLTPAQFATWIGESESWVRRRLASLPGVIRGSRKHIRIHPRTYLEKRLRIGRSDGTRRLS